MKKPVQRADDFGVAPVGQTVGRSHAKLTCSSTRVSTACPFSDGSLKYSPTRPGLPSLGEVTNDVLSKISASVGTPRLYETRAAGPPSVNAAVRPSRKLTGAKGRTWALPPPAGNAGKAFGPMTAIDLIFVRESGSRSPWFLSSTMPARAPSSATLRDSGE